MHEPGSVTHFDLPVMLAASDLVAHYVDSRSVVRQLTSAWLKLQEDAMRELWGRWVSEVDPQFFVSEPSGQNLIGPHVGVVGIGQHDQMYFSVPITLELVVG